MAASSGAEAALIGSAVPAAPPLAAQKRRGEVTQRSGLDPPHPHHDRIAQGTFLNTGSQCHPLPLRPSDLHTRVSHVVSVYTETVRDDLVELSDAEYQRRGVDSQGTATDMS